MYGNNYYSMKQTQGLEQLHSLHTVFLHKTVKGHAEVDIFGRQRVSMKGKQGRTVKDM